MRHLIKFNKENDIWDDTFRNIFHSPFFNLTDKVFDSTSYIPRVRISDDKDNFYINLEIPGVSKDDVKISLENNVLNVSANKKQSKKTEESNLIMNEIYYGEFSRSFTLSDDIKKDSIEAEFKDGVLNITLPKVEEVKPVVKEINIK